MNKTTIIKKLEPEYYKKTSEMVKAAIKISYKDLFPEILIKEFCKKYDFDNFKVKADDIEMYIATEDSDVIGVIGLKGNQLRTFYVDPNYQGKGVGSKLYRKLEEIMKKRGIKKIVLEGSPLGQPIYEHFGFKKIKSVKKERVGQKYVDAVMEKEL